MEFVTLILNPVVESLLVPVKRHLGFLVSSSSMVRKMSTKVRELENAERDMRTRQDSYIENSRVVPHGVPGWLAEVEEIKASKGTIPTGVGCFNIKTQYVAGKKSTKILEDINRLMEERAAMEWIDQIIPLGIVSPPRPSTSQGFHEEDQNRSENRIMSRDLIFENTLKSLEPNNVTQVIALCGMGGVGKTTMMKELEKVAKEKKMFDRIAKAEVGQNPDPKSIQQSVAEYLGVALTETTKDARAERLKKTMENFSKESKKKILITMDDVWKKFNLEDIGLSSPLPNGFKLLLTSRNNDICNEMGVETSLTFKIDVLQEEEAKNLFWGSIGPGSDTDPDPDMHQIGEDILKKCGGLPIAISTIASTLKVNKKKHAWKDALTRLENKRLDDRLKAIFEISYSNLKEDDLKAIFILSGLFPEDYYIETEDLLRYGWGLNFFKDMHIAAARDRVHTCIDTLISLNLLIESDNEECVKVHDLVRNFILSNFSEVKQASIVSHDNNISGQLRREVSYERILLKCGDDFELSEDFNQPDLALLILMEGGLLKFSQDSFTNMEKLEVVAYKKMDLHSLPQYTTNLRVLSLRSCSFLYELDISFLGDLINLEVLGLVDCRIKKVPSKIGKLKNLRILDLTRCDHSLCIDDGVLENLDKLEELYMEVYWKASFIRFTDANFNELKMIVNKLSTLEVEFSETAQLTDVSFEKLERFRISVGCLFDFVASSNYRSYKNTLKLVTSSSELRACKVNELFRKTEILHLEVKDMSCLESILMHPHHISFCNLRALCIFNCGELTSLFTVNVTKGLMKLESLEISWCRVLKSMIDDENSEDEEITFNKLTELELYGLPSVTSIFPENSINISSKQPFFNKKVVCPKLEILTIHSMENLKEVWPCEITSSEVDNISMLREITVKNCNSLENLFPSNPMQLLSHLEELKVEDCDSIEVLFNIEVGKSKQLSSMSSLRKIKAWNLKKLREVWRINDAKNNCSGFLITSFQFVRYLKISECERFTKIVSPSMANFDLRDLVEISIDGCGGYSEIEDILEVVFEIESPHNRDQLVINEQQALPLPLFPYLENLYLEMDSLTHVWKCSSWNEFFILHTHQHHIQSSFQNLTNIFLENSNSIKYLFSPLMVGLLSSLKRVDIFKCNGMEQLVSNRDDKDEENNISTAVNM